MLSEKVGSVYCRKCEMDSPLENASVIRRTANSTDYPHNGRPQPEFWPKIKDEERKQAGTLNLADIKSVDGLVRV